MPTRSAVRQPGARRAGACQYPLKPIAKARAKCRYIARPTRKAPVAQLDRAPDYESGGQEFEISSGAPSIFSNRLAPGFDVMSFCRRSGVASGRHFAPRGDYAEAFSWCEMPRRLGAAIKEVERTLHHDARARLSASPAASILPITRPCAIVRQAETSTQRGLQLSDRYVHKPGVRADLAAAAGKIAPQSR